ncbi:dTDP-4-dehydrorhamnose reductase [Shewanella cyperi]|uniref:dTDP-4-dehydrorhamnose reductase n=1 Tax=Shewanella cyperi TaxID=2814292 RepID=A0A974XKH0_9GAMM|nr:dTDP-4-dehydrorhamnose reductase [Shewanella cyperi]QSX28903.1 dTDP-4-dehydrorhamnose reductase [Shewanella cyperi]
MKVLITGGNGQVAKALQQTMPGEWQSVAPGHAELDITNAKSVEACIAVVRPDVVINCAAYTAVDLAEQNSEHCYAVNRDGAAIIAETTAEAGIPLVHISTDYVFDGCKKGSYTEDDLPAPLSVYGKSKLAGEQAVMAVNPRHIILRTSWVFAAEGNNFVSTMVRLGKASLAGDGKVLAIVADQRGGPTPATELARSIWTIVDRIANDEVHWGIYHYSGAPSVSWYEFAMQIFRVATTLSVLPAMPLLRPITSAEFGAKAARPLNSCLDCSKMQRAFSLHTPDWPRELEDVLKARKNRL